MGENNREEDSRRSRRRRIGCSAHPSAAFEASTLLDGLKTLHLTILETDRKIAEVCKRFPEYPFLLSIPGFGPDVSAKVLGALGNPYRFENHRQVLKTAGLDLSADRSGKRTEVTPVISKKGKADLRYGLYQAALIASTRNTHFMTYFTGKLKGRERDRHEDAGEACGKDARHRLDTHEEEGGVRSGLHKVSH